MSQTSKFPQTPKTVFLLRRIARISAWLLLVAVVVLVASGWGITHTEIIYKGTFGLIDRRLANSIHRATNLPLAFFFLTHVLINARLIFCGKKRRINWLIDTVLVALGLVSMWLVVYVEYLF